ncbi:MAG TPA: alpha/beta hydrolase [Solirubrobacteraceae bacterium]
MLLLHGQPGGAQDWSRVTAELAGRVRAIAIDRPGWDGHSPPADLQGNVRAAVATLDRCRVERATVVGHSLGAAIAAWLAAHHRSRVAGLVLVSPAANLAAIDAVDRLLAAPVVGDLTSAASLTGLGVALAVPGLRRRIAAASGISDRYLMVAGRTLLTPWARRSFLAEQRWLVHDMPALERALPQIGAPTTILSGAEDRIVHPAATRKLATQIPGARHVVLERAGHLLPQLHPGAVTDAIGLTLNQPSRL